MSRFIRTKIQKIVQNRESLDLSTWAPLGMLKELTYFTAYTPENSYQDSLGNTDNYTQSDATSHQNWNGKKYNLGLHFGNQRKGTLEKIDPDDVKITGVYDE